MFNSSNSRSFLGCFNCKSLYLLLSLLYKYCCFWDKSAWNLINEWNKIGNMCIYKEYFLVICYLIEYLITVIQVRSNKFILSVKLCQLPLSHTHRSLSCCIHAPALSRSNHICSYLHISIISSLSIGKLCLRWAPLFNLFIICFCIYIAVCLCVFYL